MKIRGWIILLITFFLTACATDRENITNAYEKQDKISILDEKASTDIGKDEESSSTQIMNSDLPEKKTASEGVIVGTYDEVEYKGIKFQIQQIAKSDSVDIVYSVMENEEDASAFKKQLLEGVLTKSAFDEDGKVQQPEWYEYIVIRCQLTNTTNENRRITMEPPLYYADGSLDKSSLEQGKNIDSSKFGPAGRTLDFYGEHYLYIHPNVGIETTDSWQYYMLKAGKSAEVVMFFDAPTLYYDSETKWYLSSEFLGGSTDVTNLTVPKGAHLITLEFD